MIAPRTAPPKAISLWLVAGALVAGQSFLAACGGVTAPTPGTKTGSDGGAEDGQSRPVDGGGDANTAQGDAGTPWSPVCPEDEPAMGDTCALNDVQCEYGCSNVLVCADGTWGGAVGFGTPIACDAGPNPSSCPTALAQITSGAGCGTTTSCTYAAGRCDCQYPADPFPDASSTWSCFPETGCPWPRPRVGSACTSSGTRCDYESCGDTQECTGGVWQTTVGDCGG